MGKRAVGVRRVWGEEGGGGQEMGENHKEVTKAEPRWTLATPRGECGTFCPAVVQARKWMELRE